MRLYEIRFLQALALTVAVEVPALFLLLRYVFKARGGGLEAYRIALAGLFASAATLPYLWFVVPAFVDSRGMQITAGEIVVVLTEALFYAVVLRLGFPRALALSAAANAASVAVGLLILR